MVTDEDLAMMERNLPPAMGINGAAARDMIERLIAGYKHYKAEAEAFPLVRMYRGDYSVIELEVAPGDRRRFVPSSAPASEDI